jgi:excisionase family DNA binding protein
VTNLGDERCGGALLLTKPEVAETLKISLRQVDYLIEQGRLTKVKIGTSARVTKHSVLKLAGVSEPAA